MAKWFKFTADYDHYWPSRAVTAFKEGMVAYVKNDVAEAAKKAGAGEETDKPADGNPSYVPTGTRSEGRRRGLTGNSVLSNRAQGPVEQEPLPPAPAETEGVSGDALSPASGGEGTETAEETSGGGRRKGGSE